MNNKKMCPVCGFNLNFEPWPLEDSASDEICPSCGTQFGYDDAIRYEKNIQKTFDIYSLLRKKWIEDGMKWKHHDKYSTKEIPKNWDPKKQLENLE